MRGMVLPPAAGHWLCVCARAYAHCVCAQEGLALREAHGRPVTGLHGGETAADRPAILPAPGPAVLVTARRTGPGPINYGSGRAYRVMAGGVAPVPAGGPLRHHGGRGGRRLAVGGARGTAGQARMAAGREHPAAAGRRRPPPAAAGALVSRSLPPSSVPPGALRS